MVRDVEEADARTANVPIDYMYLHERAGQNKEENYNPPQLVMIDHRSGSALARRVPNTGALEDAPWLPRRLVQDLEICACTNAKIQLKSDHAPATVALHAAVREMRADMIPIISHFGESESSGRVDNVIRRVQETILVFGSKLEKGTQSEVSDISPVAIWFIRWAAEVISKYVVGDDGTIAYERLGDEPCEVPVIPFSETVLS